MMKRIAAALFALACITSPASAVTELPHGIVCYGTTFLLDHLAREKGQDEVIHLGQSPTTGHRMAVAVSPAGSWTLLLLVRVSGVSPLLDGESACPLASSDW